MDIIIVLDNTIARKLHHISFSAMHCIYVGCISAILQYVPLVFWVSAVSYLAMPVSAMSMSHAFVFKCA